MIDFTFKANGDFNLSDLDSLGIELEVKDANNTTKRLKIADPSIGIETLGVHIILDRSSASQFKALIIKVRKWVGAIRVHSLPKKNYVLVLIL